MRDSASRLRVVLVIGSADRGGAEHQLVRLAARLLARGLDVRVWFLARSGPLTEELDEAHVPWEVLRPGSLPSSTASAIVTALRMGSRLAHQQPDVVFAWLPGAIWMTLTLAALLTRAKRVAALRGIELGRSRWLLRHAVRHAHAVTINAPQLREQASRYGAKRERVVYIPNGVVIPVSVANVKTQPPTAIFVANFRPYKGHDLLFDALAAVRAPLHVNLVGAGGGRDRIEKLASERGVRDRLSFAEQPANVLAELLKAQFAIHPSRSEGLPNAVLEELAVGLPVVATNVGGIPVLVENGVTGFLVPPGNASELAMRLSEMASSPEVRASMTTAARERAGTFGWTPCVDRYVTLFAELREA